jgi:uncharacterized membrane protein
MDQSNYIVLASTLHVVGLVLWIGGVAFVTLVLIPSLKKIADPDNRLELFEQLERQFALQARIMVLITGITGVYMLEFLQAWERYQHLTYWWMHMMTFIWFIFALVLFALEPLFLHRWFREQAIKNSENAFNWLHRMHQLLLTLSIVSILGAVAGSHGYQW